jgi:hypothetical protein
LNELDYLFPGFSYYSTTRKIWRISAEAFWTLLDDNCIFHSLIILQSGLFEDIFKSPIGISTPGLPATVTVPGFLG